jgi:hypothetical protein
MALRSHLRLLCIASLVGACGAAEEPSSSPNPMLERWCDGHPCGWDVEGDAKRVGTWHPDDYAISLDSDDASLSQLRAELTGALAKCFEFSLMARIDAGAHASLELDFLDDGELEFSAPIPESHWEVRTFKITPPTWYEGVRFVVRRTGGKGDVIVAELNVDLGSRPCGGTPLSLLHRPTGATCANESECESGRCEMQLSGGGMCD